MTNDADMGAPVVNLTTMRNSFGLLCPRSWKGISLLAVAVLVLGCDDKHESPLLGTSAREGIVLGNTSWKR